MTNEYDVILVGAGAAGGVVAGVLAEAGKRVLVLERGRALSFAEIGRDHLRNQRLSQYGHNAGPDIEGNPRVWVTPNGKALTVRPHEGGYHNNAAVVGGGSRVYGAQSACRGPPLLWSQHSIQSRLSNQTDPGERAGAGIRRV